VLVATIAGCGRYAEPAHANQDLADQTMVFDQDPQTSSADDHVLANREGAAGGNGAGGGGCGCN
jgi:hypothetical protein